MVAGVGMALALILGIQLGALPWRYRRELWQAQGAAFGMVVGLAIGRFSARRWSVKRWQWANSKNSRS
jgi:hypothetical protein